MENSQNSVDFFRDTPGETGKKTVKQLGNFGNDFLLKFGFHAVIVRMYMESSTLMSAL
jgi:hypothetical protein